MSDHVKDRPKDFDPRKYDYFPSSWLNVPVVEEKSVEKKEEKEEEKKASPRKKKDL